MYTKIVYSIVYSFFLTGIFVPICIKLAHRLNILDIPDGKIKKHKAPTPYLGGLAIYAGVFLGIPFYLTCVTSYFLWIFIGLSLLLVVGLIDDFLTMNPLQKLITQVFAVLCFLKGNLVIEPGFLVPWPFNTIFSFLWLLSIINAFNLIDIMDGLVATVSFWCGLFFLFIALKTSNMAVAYLISSFLGSILAFLYYNRPPAKIYLGDAGSLLIGGLFGVIPLLLAWNASDLNGFTFPFIGLAIPCLELICLVIIRTYKRIPFYKPSGDHFALVLHRKKNMSVQNILFLTTVYSFLFHILGVLLFFRVNFFSILICCLLLFASWIFIIFGQKKALLKHVF